MLETIFIGRMVQWIYGEFCLYDYLEHIMKIGDVFHRSNRLVKGEYNEKPVVRVDLNKSNNPPEDKILVRQDSDDNWKPVEGLKELSGGVSHNELSNLFGLWKDREVTKGHFSGKRWKDSKG